MRASCSSGSLRFKSHVLLVLLALTSDQRMWAVQKRCWRQIVQLLCKLATPPQQLWIMQFRRKYWASLLSWDAVSPLTSKEDLNAVESHGGLF